MLATFASLGLVAGALAITYFTVPAHLLPTFLGRLAGVAQPRTKYGQVAAVISVAFLFLAIIRLVTYRLAHAISAAWQKLIGR